MSLCGAQYSHTARLFNRVLAAVTLCSVILFPTSMFPDTECSSSAGAISHTLNRTTAFWIERIYSVERVVFNAGGSRETGVYRAAGVGDAN